MTSTTAKTSAAAEKKDVQKLQRAIIDGLEDVKAQDIQVFDTEHITSLFERVIVASGSSNRQTKALAASVRDAVRDAGFAKPRVEGEDNGEWIIVDCGAAVAHIMQPAIRQYYHLEEIWGDKPVKLKLGAPAPLAKASKADAGSDAKPKATRSAGAKTPAKAGVKTAAKPAAKTSSKAPSKAPAKAAPAKSAAKPAVKTPVIKVPEPKKVTARKTAAKTAGKTAAKKPAARKTASRSK